MVLDALTAYQQSAAMKTAIELDVFSAIGRGARSVKAIAEAVKASERGVRILCDFLVIHGFLTKAGAEYSLTPTSAVFLDRSSPACFGTVALFMLDPRLIAPFLNLTEIVRSGRTTLSGEGTVSPDNPIWIDFARHMAPLVYGAAVEMAELAAGDGELRVLDIAAGHGLFGIMMAQRNPKARITAVDWPNVLTVAAENAQKFGVASRHTTLPGDAFEVQFGGPHDMVLVTNFFHHFDQPTCERLMRKILASMARGGKCLTLDFVPNDDRVSPPTAAGFAMMMLGNTAAGDVYTFGEYDRMFRNAGFATSESHTLQKAPQTLIVSKRP